MTASQPIACSLTDPELGRRLDHLRTGLFARARAVRPDADGFSFVFDGTDHNVADLLDVVSFERQCCPFLTFRVDIVPEPGDLVLHLGGNAGTQHSFATHL
jgi:hypothetical protein